MIVHSLVYSAATGGQKIGSRAQRHARGSQVQPYIPIRARSLEHSHLRMSAFFRLKRMGPSSRATNTEAQFVAQEVLRAISRASGTETLRNGGFPTGALGVKPRRRASTKPGPP